MNITSSNQPESRRLADALDQPRIGMISNPNSGANRKHLQQINAIVAKQPAILHRVTSSADEIPAVLQQFKEQSINVLAINGGDGTTAEVFTHLLRDQALQPLPLFVLLPGGTTNMNVGDVGIRGDLRKAVKTLCAWPDQNRQTTEILQRSIVKVVPGDEALPVYGMFMGAGAIIQGIEYCHEKIHSRGVGNEIGPGLAMARTLWGILRRDPRFIQPVKTTVTLNNQSEPIEQSMLLMLVSSLERLFLGMHPYWGTESGTLHCSMISEDAPRFIRTLPSLLRGRPPRHATPENGYRSHNVDSLSLQMNGMLTLDGEMYNIDQTTGPARISDGGVLSFIRLK
ncbi:MAG: diacylglycerol kinase family protein [Gammaproteobacteria bacterium]